MDYGELTPSIIDKILEAMKIINNPEIEPEVRQLNQEILFREVGESVYNKVYEMNAFDFEIEHTSGPGIDDRYLGLSKVASDSISVGDVGVAVYVKNYLDNVMGKAQQDAFVNASQSGKRPRVIRRTVGDTCKWCRDRAGTFTDPDPTVFQRHRACDCTITTEGFRSRNGQLNNFVGQ